MLTVKRFLNKCQANEIEKEQLGTPLVSSQALMFKIESKTSMLYPQTTNSLHMQSMITAGAYLEPFIQILLKRIKSPSVKAKTNYC